MDLIITCAVGLEDLLRGDLQQAGAAATVSGPGALQVTTDDIEFLRQNTMVDRMAVPWSAGDPLADQVESACRAAGYEGEIAFRIHEKDLLSRERVIEQVQLATGWHNDPSDWQVNIDPALGRAEIGPLAWAARFGTMQRLPATTPPAVAAGVLRLAKLRPGMSLVDPCGGVGTIPIVDALQRSGRGLTIDLSPESVRQAGENIHQLGLEGRVLAERGDATDLDLADGSVDRVVCDIPFGKRIGSNRQNDQLYPGLLGELDRVLVGDGKAVIITDDKRRFVRAVAAERGLKVVKETPLRYNGVTPTAFSLNRVRGRSRSPGR